MSELIWNAEPLIKRLTLTNKLARQNHFEFCRVSSLAGLEGMLQRMQQAVALVCLADESDGNICLNNTRHSHFAKTVFLAIRYSMSDMDARDGAFRILREVFRQFLSVISQEKVRLQQKKIYLDNQIHFHEIPEYFAAGYACAYFNLYIGKYVNTIYNPDEWLDDEAESI